MPSSVCSQELAFAFKDDHSIGARIGIEPVYRSNSIDQAFLTATWTEQSSLQGEKALLCA